MASPDWGATQGWKARIGDERIHVTIDVDMPGTPHTLGGSDGLTLQQGHVTIDRHGRAEQRLVGSGSWLTPPCSPRPSASARCASTTPRWRRPSHRSRRRPLRWRTRSSGSPRTTTRAPPAPRTIRHWTMLETTLHPDPQRLATAIAGALHSVEALNPGLTIGLVPADPVRRLHDRWSRGDTRTPARIQVDAWQVSGQIGGSLRGGPLRRSFEVVLTPHTWTSALAGTTPAPALSRRRTVRRCARRHPRRADRHGHAAPSVRRFDHRSYAASSSRSRCLAP